MFFPLRNYEVPTDEELIRYLRAGWHIHKKRVKKYLYLVRRKGQSTRSLGSYSDELWSRIQNLEHKLTLEREGLLVENSQPIDDTTGEMRRKARRRFVKGRDDIIKNMSLWRGSVMSLDCKNRTNDFCTFWIWEEKMPFFSSIEDTKIPGAEYLREYKDETGTKGWIVKADSFYCSNCPYYEPLEKRESYPVLSFMEQRMRESKARA